MERKEAFTHGNYKGNVIYNGKTGEGKMKTKEEIKRLRCLQSVQRCKERRMAITILENIAEELGRPTIFDCKNGDDRWYRFEDMLTEIIIYRRSV